MPLFTAFAAPAIAFISMPAVASWSFVICAAEASSSPGTAWPPTRRGGLSPPEPGMPTRSHIRSWSNGAAHTGFPAAALGGSAPNHSDLHVRHYGHTQGSAGATPGSGSLSNLCRVRPGNLRRRHILECSRPRMGYGLYFGILATFSTGVLSVLQEGGFSAEATLEILSRYGVTNFAGAPTLYRSLRVSDVRRPNNLKLRCASSAGEPLPRKSTSGRKPRSG